MDLYCDCDASALTLLTVKEVPHGKLKFIELNQKLIRQKKEIKLLQFFLNSGHSARHVIFLKHPILIWYVHHVGKNWGFY